MKPTRIYERKHRQTRLHRMMIAVRHFTSYLQTIGVLLLIALTLSGCFVLSGSGLPTDSSPTPTIVSRPTASPTPVPTLVSTPIPPRSPENGALYDAEVQEYTGLVVEKNMIQAYHMLSTILQGQMTFQQFLANSDYTLPQGCATPGEIVYSIQQLDGTWSIN